MGKKENLDLLNKYFKFGSLKRLAAEPEEDTEDSEEQDLADELAEGQEKSDFRNPEDTPDIDTRGAKKNTKKNKQVDLVDEGVSFGSDDGESGNDDEVDTGEGSQLSITQGGDDIADPDKKEEDYQTARDKRNAWYGFYPEEKKLLPGQKSKLDQYFKACVALGLLYRDNLKEKDKVFSRIIGELGEEKKVLKLNDDELEALVYEAILGDGIEPAVQTRIDTKIIKFSHGKETDKLQLKEKTIPGLISYINDHIKPEEKTQIEKIMAIFSKIESGVYGEFDAGDSKQKENGKLIHAYETAPEFKRYKTFIETKGLYEGVAKKVLKSLPTRGTINIFKGHGNDITPEMVQGAFHSAISGSTSFALNKVDDKGLYDPHERSLSGLKVHQDRNANEVNCGTIVTHGRKKYLIPNLPPIATIFLESTKVRSKPVADINTAKVETLNSQLVDHIINQTRARSNDEAMIESVKRSEGSSEIEKIEAAVRSSMGYFGGMKNIKDGGASFYNKKNPLLNKYSITLKEYKILVMTQALFSSFLKISNPLEESLNKKIYVDLSTVLYAKLGKENTEKELKREIALIKEKIEELGPAINKQEKIIKSTSKILAEEEGKTNLLRSNPTLQAKITKLKEELEVESKNLEVLNKKKAELEKDIESHIESIDSNLEEINKLTAKEKDLKDVIQKSLDKLKSIASSRSKLRQYIETNYQQVTAFFSKSPTFQGINRNALEKEEEAAERIKTQKFELKSAIALFPQLKEKIINILCESGPITLVSKSKEDPASITFSIDKGICERTLDNLFKHWTTGSTASWERQVSAEIRDIVNDAKKNAELADKDAPAVPYGAVKDFTGKVLRSLEIGKKMAPFTSPETSSDEDATKQYEDKNNFYKILKNTFEKHFSAFATKAEIDAELDKAFENYKVRDLKRPNSKKNPLQSGEWDIAIEKTVHEVAFALFERKAISLGHVFEHTPASEEKVKNRVFKILEEVAPAAKYTNYDTGVVQKAYSRVGDPDHQGLNNAVKKSLDAGSQDSKEADTLKKTFNTTLSEIELTREGGLTRSEIDALEERITEVLLGASLEKLAEVEVKLAKKEGIALTKEDAVERAIKAAKANIFGNGSSIAGHMHSIRQHIEKGLADGSIKEKNVDELLEAVGGYHGSSIDHISHLFDQHGIETEELGKLVEEVELKKVGLLRKVEDSKKQIEETLANIGDPDSEKIKALQSIISNSEEDISLLDKRLFEKRNLAKFLERHVKAIPLYKDEKNVKKKHHKIMEAMDTRERINQSGIKRLGDLSTAGRDNMFTVNHKGNVLKASEFNLGRSKSYNPLEDLKVLKRVLDGSLNIFTLGGEGGILDELIAILSGEDDKQNFDRLKKIIESTFSMNGEFISKFKAILKAKAPKDLSPEDAKILELVEGAKRSGQGGRKSDGFKLLALQERYPDENWFEISKKERQERFDKLQEEIKHKGGTSDADLPKEEVMGKKQREIEERVARSIGQLLTHKFSLTSKDLNTRDAIERKSAQEAEIEKAFAKGAAERVGLISKVIHVARNPTSKGGNAGSLFKRLQKAMEREGAIDEFNGLFVKGNIIQLAEMTAREVADQNVEGVKKNVGLKLSDTERRQYLSSERGQKDLFKAFEVLLGDEVKLFHTKFKDGGDDHAKNVETSAALALLLRDILEGNKPEISVAVVDMMFDLDKDPVHKAQLELDDIESEKAVKTQELKKIETDDDLDLDEKQEKSEEILKGLKKLEADRLKALENLKALEDNSDRIKENKRLKNEFNSFLNRHYTAHIKILERSAFLEASDSSKTAERNQHLKTGYNIEMRNDVSRAINSCTKLKSDIRDIISIIENRYKPVIAFDAKEGKDPAEGLAKAAAQSKMALESVLVGLLKKATVILNQLKADIV
jgi:hypothetical protein